jgi:hypothetical protein
MNLLTSIMRALGWPAPAVAVPRRKRYGPTPCPVCHRVFQAKKDLTPWAHKCRPEPPIPADRVDEDDERGGRR